MPLLLDNDNSTDTRFENAHYIDIEGNSEENLPIVHFMPIPNQELVAENDALSAIIKFHINGEGHNSLKREIVKQTGLFTVAIFGVIFYYVPAKMYAESICIDPTYKDISCNFFVVNHVAGTMIIAAGILMSATNTFFDQQKAESIPSELIHYLEYLLTYKEKLAENIFTYTGSFIASIPFIIITVVNRIPGLPNSVIALQAFFVGVTNTLLHLLPFKLALKNSLYRLPFLPIEFLIKMISNVSISEERKQEKVLEQSISAGFQIIKQRLITHLAYGQRLLSIYGFEGQEHIRASALPPIELLTKLLEGLFAKTANQTIAPSRIHCINNSFRKIIYIPGAAWVILSCAGFWGGTFNEVVELTENTVAASFISAPSIYCLNVLLAFFGGVALQNVYDYLTDWKDDTVKIPMTFKLYPRTATFLIFISLYLSVFSYAAGAQLINDNFNGELKFLRPYLLELAKTGLIFLGFTAMLDFINNLLKKFIQYGGAEEAQTLINLWYALDQMKNSIQLMKPKFLLESLANIQEEQLKNVLGIKDKIDLQNFSVSLMQLADQLKIKLLKKIELNNKFEKKIIIKLKNQLAMDYDYKISTIEAWINFLDKKDELITDLKQDCQHYKFVCEMIKKLDSINLVNDSEFNILPRNSINDDNNLSRSSEMEEPLIPKVKKPFFADYFNFFSSSRRNAYGTNSTNLEKVIDNTSNDFCIPSTSLSTS